PIAIVATAIAASVGRLAGPRGSALWQWLRRRQAFPVDLPFVGPIWRRIPQPWQALLGGKWCSQTREEASGSK
ncbi:MAG: hypothetical protein AB7F78_25965, partial [Hyphomicrobiaceae bacterium]